MSKLRFGILGTGNIAGQFAAGVAGAERTEVVTVGSRSKTSADAFAQKHGVPASHASYQALLGDDAVDAVYVSLPNTMHHEWTLAALRAGKHVLCEKPLTPTAAEAEELFDEARKQGRILVEAFMYRCHPMMKEVVARVREGAIGRLKLVRASFCYATSNVDDNIRFRPELCGGSIMDIGCYCVDLGRLLTGEHPSSVQIAAHVHESGVDDYAAGTLAYPGGAVLTFACGQTVQANNAALVCGDKGYIEIPIPWKPPVTGATYTLKGQTPPRQDKKAGTAPAPDEHTVDAGRPLYGLEADDFAAVVLDGAAPAMTRDDSISNARVLEALRREAGLRY